MTTQEEATYITKLLPLLVRQPAGCDISEQGLDLHPNDLIRLTRRIQSEDLATQNDPRFTFYLAITPKGLQIAELPGGYAEYLQQEVAKAQQQLKKELQAQTNTWLTTIAAIVSAVAAVVAIWVSVAANGNSDTTNAQVEALTKRVQALEAQAKQQRQHP
jgi:polyhydroxyalkanoate synthesis regulator phasin